MAGIALVGWTLYDYHLTLQFIAVIGLFTTAVSVVTGYESAEVRRSHQQLKYEEPAFAKGSVFGKAHASVS